MKRIVFYVGITNGDLMTEKPFIYYEQAENRKIELIKAGYFPDGILILPVIESWKDYQEFKNHTISD